MNVLSTTTILALYLGKEPFQMCCFLWAFPWPCRSLQNYWLLHSLLCPCYGLVGETSVKSTVWADIADIQGMIWLLPPFRWILHLHRAAWIQLLLSGVHWPSVKFGAGLGVSSLAKVLCLHSWVGTLLINILFSVLLHTISVYNPTCIEKCTCVVQSETFLCMMDC